MPIRPQREALLNVTQDLGTPSLTQGLTVGESPSTGRGGEEGLDTITQVLSPIPGMHPWLYRYGT